MKGLEKVFNSASKSISKTQMSGAQALEAFNNLINAYKDNHQVIEIEKTKRTQINAMKDIEIEKIRAQKEILKQYLEETFAERKTIIREMFSHLDQGVENNNLELIQYSINAIVSIAKDSPLKQIEKLKNDFRNPDIKEVEI